MKTKNITVSVDEETHRRARIRAAELDTSVSALVRGYLRSLAGEQSNGPGALARTQADEFDRQRLRMNEVIEEITANDAGLRVADNLPREELYDRAKARREAREAAPSESQEHEHE